MPAERKRSANRSQELVETDHQEIRVEYVPISAGSGSEQVNGPEGWVGLLRGKNLTQLLMECSEPAPMTLIAQLLRRASAPQSSVLHS